METLRELSLILTRNKVKSIDVLDPHRHKNSKVNIFYEGLLAKEYVDEEDAMMKLFPGKKDKGSFRKLKASLKTKMINTLFFIDTKKNTYTDRQSAYYTCQKDWAAINILVGKNAYNVAIELCVKVLRYARKYEFYDLARDTTQVLYVYYSNTVGNKSKYYEYRDLFEAYSELCYWNAKACTYYSNIIVEFVKNHSQKEHLQTQITEYLAELAPMREKSDAYQLHLYSNLLQLVMYSNIHDYEKLLEVAEQMTDFFQAKSYKAATALQIAAYYRLMACTQLRAFEQGSAIAEECITLLAEGSYNWFKFYELYFNLAMHTGNYEKAYLIFCIVEQHPRFKYLPEQIKEVWTIYEAYLHYLVQLGKIESAADNRRFNKFRLGKFLNQTPIYSQDKKGMNIAILTIQILFLIQQKKYNVSIDKFEAIEKYCSRYIHESATLRSYYLLKMLLCIVEANFHRVAAQRKAERWLKKLQEIPIQEADQTYQIEVLPYAEIWKMALQSLSAKIYLQPRRMLRG